MTQPIEVPRQAHPPPPALDVIIRGQEDPVAYACPTCGQLFILSRRDSVEERVRKAQAAAHHCVKECVCGKPIDYHYYLRCKDCRLEAEVQKEQERFEKAEKLTIEAYDGPVYWETGCSGDMGDGYFSDVDSLLDYCEQEGIDVPEYVWACASSSFQLEADAIIEHALERQDAYEDAFDSIKDDARARLQAYLTVWTKEVDLTFWHDDHSRAVLLREAEIPPPPPSAPRDITK